jgi:hypothetical protein
MKKDIAVLSIHCQYLRQYIMAEQTSFVLGNYRIQNLRLQTVI